MSNPWMKKNPFLSMWMSGANAVVGTARGHAHAAAKRQGSALMASATQQTLRYWSSILAPSTRGSRKRK
jgi:hypothetical protein